MTDDAVLMCDRVTGSQLLPTSPSGRRVGARRADGRHDVLCDHPARWRVNGTPACDRDVVALAQLTGQASVALVSLTYADRHAVPDGDITPKGST